MKNTILSTWMALLFLTSLLALPGFAAVTTTPNTNHGAKWKLAYYQGGNYQNYPVVLRAVVESLEQMRWIEKFKWPDSLDMNDPHQIWSWLAANSNSRYLEFSKDDFFTSDWDVNKRKKVRAQALKRLNTPNAIDIIFAMGTWAGQDLATKEQSVPTIVMSTSNPIQSKIIKSASDSGYDNVFTNVDPTRYQRQVQIFHDIIKFKKLGIVYEDTLAGRSYAAVDDVNKVAAKDGFKVVSCMVPSSKVSDEKETAAAILACHKKLAPQIDAFYLTVHRGVSSKNLRVLLEPFYHHNVPVFSQLGGEQVRNGALLSISRAGFKYLGRFYAKAIAKILNGAIPRWLSMLFPEPPRIALNLEVAKMIGFDPPLDVLAAADEIYQRIGQGKKM